MDPDERKMLQEAVELSRENNKIVRKMWRLAQWGRAIKAVYWIILIGITIGAFYFLQPYVETLQGVYGTIGDAQEQVRTLFTN